MAGDQHPPRLGVELTAFSPTSAFARANSPSEGSGSSFPVKRYSLKTGLIVGSNAPPDLRYIRNEMSSVSAVQGSIVADAPLCSPRIRATSESSR